MPCVRRRWGQAHDGDLHPAVLAVVDDVKNSMISVFHLKSILKYFKTFFRAAYLLILGTNVVGLSFPLNKQTLKRR